MIEREEKIILINHTQIREHDCIWCMAYVTVCPTQAIQVDEANLEVHKKQQKQQVKQVCLVLSSIK